MRRTTKVIIQVIITISKEVESFDDTDILTRLSFELI